MCLYREVIKYSFSLTTNTYERRIHYQIKKKKAKPEKLNIPSTSTNTSCLNSPALRNRYTKAPTSSRRMNAPQVAAVITTPIFFFLLEAAE